MAERLLEAAGWSDEALDRLATVNDEDLESAVAFFESAVPSRERALITAGTFPDDDPREG